jgi:hypothetical protein
MRFSRVIDGPKIGRRYYTGRSAPTASEPPRARIDFRALGSGPAGYENDATAPADQREVDSEMAVRRHGV